jgi:SulP family sulfate permease
MAQFDNPLVREVIADQIKLKQEMSELDQVIAEAGRKYRDTVDQYGVSDTNTLVAKLAHDSLKLKRERRSKTAKLDLDEVKAQRFQYSPGPDAGSGRLYDVGHVPAGIATDGRLWRVRSIDGEKLVLNGGGNVVGGIPEGLPSLVLPKFDFGVILQLLSAAITIALIGFVEAISIAKAMATKTRHRLNANQELIGQGLANIAGSLTQSYPTSGSFSRSAVNFSAGAVTGFSSVVTSIIVIVTLLWLTPLLYHLPQATLAAVIMVAVVGLINVKAIKHAWQAQRHDGIVAITTFALTLAFAPHMDKGILAGAALALILYLYRTMQPHVAVLARHSDGTLRDAEALGLDLCENISMIRFDGQLYFANTVHFESKVMERVALRPDLKYVIVVGDGINQIDATGEDTLAHLADRLKVAGISLLFTGLKKQTLEVLRRTGFYDRIGAESFFRTEDQALDFVWKKLGNNHEVDCPLNIVCPVTPPK